MDIQGWLQETADRAPPNPSDEVDALPSGPSAHVEATKSKHYRRKRKRTASDSSLIALQQWVERRGKADDRSANATRDRPAAVIVTHSNPASRHRRPRSQERSTDGRVQASDQKTYERRARRKTKPDRYESKKKKNVKERKEGDGAGERHSKRKRSRAHRSGDGKRTESLVQGFKLKNGPLNSRLTLKPDHTAGLFRHGRASAQMAGRSNGLPDLVFNELKFLRDPHEHQDERSPNNDARGPSLQEKKRETEREEISAYFKQRTSRDHALEPSLNRRSEIRRNSPHYDEEHIDLPDGGSSPILPDEELTANPYLGFGSRGTVNHSGNPHPSGTTYLTWSESGASPDVQTLRTTNARTSRMSTVKKAQRRRAERDPSSGPSSDAAESPARQNSVRVPRGQWSTSRRTRDPAKVEVYIQQRDAEPNLATSKRKSHHSTSMSLPTRTPAGSARQGQQKATIQQQVLSSYAGSFNTSDIVKLRDRLGALAEEAPSTIKHIHAPQSEKENVQPISSSPTAKILRIAHEAMATSHEEPVASVGHLHRHVDRDERRHNPYTFDDAKHRRNYVYSRNPSDEESTYHPMHTYAITQARTFHQQLRQDAETVSAAGFDQEDEEMLDGHPIFEPTLAHHTDAMPDHVPAHTYAPPDARSDLHSLSFRFDRRSTRARGFPWSRDDMSTTHRDTSSHVAAAEQSLMTGDDHVGGRDFDDGLEGFWRPNRLY